MPKAYGCDKYQLSLDGLEGTHDQIHKAGSFRTTLEKISCLRAAGIKCAIMATVSNTNIREIPALIDVVVEYQADIFAFARYCPNSFEPDTHVIPEAYQEFLGICWEKFKDYQDSGTTFYLKDHLWTLFLYERCLLSQSTCRMK